MGEAQASDQLTEPNCFNLSAFASIIPIVSIRGVASGPLIYEYAGQHNTGRSVSYDSSDFPAIPQACRPS
jgi:hypothetical protein